MAEVLRVVVPRGRAARRCAPSPTRSCCAASRSRPSTASRSASRARPRPRPAEREVVGRIGRQLRVRAGDGRSLRGVPRRHPSYYRVAGIDLRARAAAPARPGGVRRWAACSRGARAARSAGRRGGRTGSASPSPASTGSRSPTIRGSGRATSLETLLHELVHLHVGRPRGAHAWHGRGVQARSGAGDGRGLRGHVRPRTPAWDLRRRARAPAAAGGRAARAAARRLEQPTPSIVRPANG